MGGKGLDRVALPRLEIGVGNQLAVEIGPHHRAIRAALVDEGDRDGGVGVLGLGVKRAERRLRLGHRYDCRQSQRGQDDHRREHRRCEQRSPHVLLSPAAGFAAARLRARAPPGKQSRL